MPSGVEEVEHPFGAFGDDRTAEQRLGRPDEAGVVADSRGAERRVPGRHGQVMTADSAAGVALVIPGLVGVGDGGIHLVGQRPGHVAEKGWEYDKAERAVVIDLGVAEHR